jgi:GNAT superfamily N-acetyltransferase
MPFSTVSFDGDELDTTVHIVAFTGDVATGCVTLLRDPAQQSIQLRGMAVKADYQGLGIGARLLGEAQEIAKAHQKNLWCNARQSAISFYEKNGWTAYGPFFEIPIIGQHVAMRWKIPDREP